ncbi:hypothetical protein C1W80_08205 [Burkholderia pseudomallei]|nr:hypothetical protein [Burkholderia pseudomallei]
MGFRPRHRSPLTAHRSPLTAHRSPLTAHRSPLTAHRSPLTAHRSPLTAHRSPLTAHRSPHRRASARRLRDRAAHARQPPPLVFKRQRFAQIDNPSALAYIRPHASGERAAAVR